MVQNEKNFKETLEVMRNALASMNGLTNALKALNVEVATLDSKLAEDAKAVEAEVKPATVADVERIVGSRFNNQFAGFVNWGLDSDLKAGVLYDFDIHDAKVTGSLLQLVVCFYQRDVEDNCYVTVGLSVQNYVIGSPEYKEMVETIYSPPFPMLISVNTDELVEIDGKIALKECNGALVLDWNHYEPDTVPCGREWEFSETLLEEMN